MSKIIFIIVVFILGLYFTCSYKSSDIYEGFDNNNSSCPNILIQKGSEIYLHNSKQANIPGVNPIKFNNLEDYVEFLNWQKSQNINCPVLFLQHSYDTQGKAIYKVRPSPTDLQGGLPPTLPYKNAQVPLGEKEMPVTKLYDASRDDPPYNENSYPGYDPMNMYEGEYTPLDKMFHMEESKAVSSNPMDVNWGGVEYSQKVVDSGYYDANK